MNPLVAELSAAANAYHTNPTPENEALIDSILQRFSFMELARYLLSSPITSSVYSARQCESIPLELALKAARHVSKEEAAKFFAKVRR